MLTIEPELRPYSALNVELLILNSDVVLIDGWNVIWFWLISFRLIPLIWKFTESSRLPAVLKEFAPRPRLAAVRLPAVGATTPPGVNVVRSRKWRPLRGSSCTVLLPMT